MTQVVCSVEEWRQIQRKIGKKTLGYVPTMGNLHKGHLSLVERAQQENDLTVLSVYVNPTQFDQAEDFTHYPRTLDSDKTLCEQHGIDYLFLPSYKEMYPDGYRYRLIEREHSLIMEGRYRPGHFDGVLTVVLKLLVLLRPDRAYFGEKDYQQLQLVSGMAQAFLLETQIVPCETVRNAFGVALSSRLGRLTAGQLNQARSFYSCLVSGNSCDEVTAALQEKGFRVEYVQEQQGRRFAAVYLGEVRLIDNVEIKTRS